MRVSVIVGLIAGLAASGAWAQQPQTFHAKNYNSTPTKKPSKATPVVKAPNATTDAAQQLRRIEQQSVKAPARVKTAGPKTGAGSAAAFKPEKPKPTPPITANVPGGMGTNMKGVGSTNQGKNPYKGRLRQKGSKQ